jgi:hypothetical protein
MRPKLLTRYALSGLGGGILSLLLLYSLLCATAYPLLGRERGDLVTGPCGESTELEKTSPDARYVAVAFVRNCGATTGFVSHVNIRPKQVSFRVNKSGTIDDGCVYLSDYGADTSLHWNGARHLAIRSRLGKVFVKKYGWRDITISYE